MNEAQVFFFGMAYGQYLAGGVGAPPGGGGEDPNRPWRPMSSHEADAVPAAQQRKKKVAAHNSSARRRRRPTTAAGTSPGTGLTPALSATAASTVPEPCTGTSATTRSAPGAAWRRRPSRR